MIKELADFLDLKDLYEFYIPKFIYNSNPYNEIIFDIDLGYCLQYDREDSKFLTIINKMSEEEQLRLLNHLKTPTLKNCLLQLERAGWSTLIESRWEDDVRTLLKESFPEISDDLLQEVLDLVLV